MLVLAVDTATPAVTAGIVRVEGAGLEVLAGRVTVDARAHGELLTPHVLECVAEAGVDLGELAAVVCGVGPGPFTGLRAGVATAAAFGDALGIPTYPVCSLDALAVEAVRDSAVRDGKSFVVVTDARRREVYWARYDNVGNRVDGPHVRRPGDLAETLDGIDFAVGDGARLYADVLGISVVEPRFPTPEGLVSVAEKALHSGKPDTLTPLYLRRPDAVEPAARKKVTAS